MKRNYSSVRILNPSNVKRSSEGRLFHFERIDEDEMYEIMQKKIDRFYQRLVNGNAKPKEKVATGDKAVLRLSGSIFQRVRVTGRSFQAGGETTFVNVSYLDSDGPIMTVLKQDLYTMELGFAAVAPRKQYLTLEGLSGYTDVPCFEQLIQQYSKDLFTGKLIAEFLKVSKERHALTAVIRGEKYPQNKFPFGLNGLIIDKLLERMKGSSASKLTNMKRDLGETTQVLSIANAMVVEGQRVGVTLDWFIWSDADEPFEIFSPGKTCLVEIVEASPDGKVVAIVSPKRKGLLKKLEMELLKEHEFNFRYQKEDVFFTLKTAKCFVYFWYQRAIYARVLIVKNLEGLHDLQQAGLGSVNAICDLYLIDYGIKLRDIPWQQLRKMPHEACRYPPFAVVGSVQGDNYLKGASNCTNATMDSLTFDQFGVPLAQVRLSAIGI